MNLRDDLEDILLAWGRLYGKGREYMEDRSLTGNSTLARIMGKPKQDATVGRNGISRRTMMGAAAGRFTGKDAKRPVPVQMWACDPVSGKQTRSHKPESDRLETPAIVRVQTAWMELHRVSEQQASTIRLHYQRRDMSREERARALRLTVRAYRDSLAKARMFIHEKLVA